MLNNLSMKKYFNIQLEFNHNRLEHRIEETSKQGKGYCCFVDLTSFVYSQNNPYFKEIVKNI